MANVAEGILREHFAQIDSTFDTPTAFVANDAFYPIDVKLEPFQNFEEIAEAAGTASLQGEIKEGRGGRWTVTCYIKPGAVGVAPDSGVFWQAGFGTEAIAGGTSVTYTLDDATVDSIQIGKKTGLYLYEEASGAWVEQIVIDTTGNQAARITFSGGYARHIWVYNTAPAGTIAAGQSVVLMAQAGMTNVGALIKFGSEDNGGAGYSVTGMSADGLSITVSPVLAGEVTAADTLSPVLPTGTAETGDAINGVQDALTFDAVAVGSISAKYTIDTGIHALDKESDSDRATALARGTRRVTTQHDCYYLDTETGPLLGRAWDGTKRAVVHRIGPSTAAKKLTVTLPKDKLDVSSIDVPEADESTFSIAGKAHMSASAGDELSAVFD